jgi:isopenicillin-N N-acyltransferase-like protein
MNAEGLGITTNFLVSRRDDGSPGVPYHVTLRLLLECATVAEAVELLRAVPPTSYANNQHADDGGHAVDAEVLPGGPDGVHLVEPNDGFVAHTNHYDLDHLGAEDVGVSVAPSTTERLARLRALFGAREAPVAPHHIQAALTDHVNLPGAICCHPDPALDEAARPLTALSIVMDLDDRRVWMAPGLPCITAYEELDVSDLLAPSSAVRG